ncbi:PREDICTED: thiopurine S-methyltransferase-like [Amphimedon queenslandica]|nr:PREDICTED: thiopurine S-methyltransferase-like [Amphimedon queenslandica]|eukprot:XP_019849332.1 PREDICTED: thiopurine S-methyltransferase-like [Amphimedon queenslandica]
MKWLAAQKGHNVVGIDIVDLSAQQFFAENNVPFNKYTIDDDFFVYESTENAIKIKFFVGDIFDVSAQSAGYFDAVWDCNALVAIKPPDRNKYICKIDSLLKPSGCILLSTYEYDPTLHNTDPYPMTPDDIKLLFSSFYVQLVETMDASEYFNFKFPWSKRHVFQIKRK